LSSRVWIPIVFCFFSAIHVVYAGSLDSLRGQRVVVIRFESTGLSPAEAFQYLEIHPGDKFSVGAIRRSVKLLYHLGLFGQVRVTAKRNQNGVELVFNLVPKRRVLAVKFTGNQVVTTSELRRIFRFSRGEEFDRWKIESVISDMQALYQSRGYRRVQIVPKVEGPDEGDVTIRYYIQEGPPTRISKLWFKGQYVFSPRKLKEILNLEAGDVLDQEQMQEALKRLRDFYLKNEYLEAQIRIPKIDFELTALWEVVPIEIRAGRKVSIRFIGNKVISSKKLREEIKIDLEIELNIHTLRDIADRIERRYRNYGYARVQVVPSGSLGAFGKHKYIIFHIDEGPRLDRAPQITVGSERGLSYLPLPSSMLAPDG